MGDAGRPSPRPRAATTTHDGTNLDGKRDGDGNTSALDFDRAAAGVERRRASDAEQHERANHKRTRRYLRREHIRATVRVAVGVFLAIAVLGNIAAFVSTRAHDTVGLPTPSVSWVMPTAFGIVLGLIAGVVYGIAMRPKRLGSSPISGAGAPTRGGRLWPGTAAAPVGGDVRSGVAGVTS